jgi:DNA-binding NtrC family response regulator
METRRPAVEGLLGRCPAMERVRRNVELFGPSDVRVHVFGESGTGKEGVAQALHEASPRARRKMVKVNVAAFSDELLVGELFGHTRGAFTGAVAARDGYVAEADGSTLFVDEVGDMSPLAQVRLLRFLENGEYQRLGETVTRRADVRIVSATHVDLARRVREGRFRLDLWFRLKGEILSLPPLRDRGDDVLFLARHFLRVHAAAPPPLSPESEAALLAHSWPGNVRELQNLVHRLVVMTEGGVIDIPDLPAPMRFSVLTEQLPRHTLATVEVDYIRRVLESVAGNRTRAAEILGIDRKTLREKLHRAGWTGARRR